MMLCIMEFFYSKMDGTGSFTQRLKKQGGFKENEPSNI